MQQVPNYETNSMRPATGGETAGTTPAPTKGKTMAAKKKAARKAAKPKTDADRSKAIAKTWKDKGVAAARSTHHAVKVGGTVYRSVKDAFTQLKLPLGRRGPFRLALKAQGVGGTLDFEHVVNGKTVKVRFTLIDLPSKTEGKKGGKPAVKKVAGKKVASKKVAAKRKAAPKKASPAPEAAAPVAEQPEAVAAV
jgi:adenylate kinase